MAQIDSSERVALGYVTAFAGEKEVALTRSTSSRPLSPGVPAALHQDIRFCTTPSGVTLAHASLGAGPPLVKVANWLTHLEFDLASPVWRPWLERFSRHFSLVRYDQRGCGLSDRDVRELSLAAWIEDLETVINDLGLERFPLFAMSQGAAVAVAYAVKHPERVSHLVILGGYARGKAHRNLDPAMREEAEMLVRLVGLGWGQDTPAFRQLFSSLLAPGGGPEHFAALNELARESTSPGTAARIMRAFDEVTVEALAPQVRAPTLVLHARGDARVPFAEGRHLAALVPGAHFVPLASSNHVLLEGEPAWDAFFAEMLVFLGATPEQSIATAPAPAPVLADLTPRERDVLGQLACGRRNKEIARALGLSPKTVRNYTSSLLGKLGLRSRGEATALARASGLGDETS